MFLRDVWNFAHLDASLAFVIVTVLSCGLHSGAQIVSRSSADPLVDTALNRTIEKPDFSLSAQTRDILKEIFHRGDRVTVAPVASQPNNAVLLDSFLLRTRPVSRETRTDEPSTSAIYSVSSIALDANESFTTTRSPASTFPPTPTIMSTEAETSTSQASTRNRTKHSGRQGKGRPTGRPNVFYLGGSGDADGWWSSLEDSFEDGLLPLADPAVPSTTEPGQQFGSFYGGQPVTGRPLSSSESGSQSIPPPFKLPVPSSGMAASRVSITDSAPFSSLPGIQSSGSSASDTIPPSSFYNTPREQPLDPNFRARQPTPDWEPPTVFGGRRQGSVLAAPDPVPQPGRGPPPRQQSNGFSSPAGGQPNNRNHPVMSTGSDDIQLETCSIGDDSTCNYMGNEVCRKDDGASTCMCRLGTARKSVRDHCQGAVNFFVFVRINRLLDRPISYGPQFADSSSYPYTVLSREVTLGVDSILRSSDLRENYVATEVNSFAMFADDILANTTVTFINFPPESPALPRRIQQALVDSVGRSDRRLGSSNVYVSHSLTSVPNVQDINECLSSEYNDCNTTAQCTNTVGSFTCSCKTGYADSYASDSLKSGRYCETCEESFCNGKGICLMGAKGKICQCNGWHIGSACEIDGQVIAVACGSSAIAVILIAVTLVFLLRWSRSNSSHRGGSGSTLAHSEISANTFTYVHGKTHGVASDASLNTRDRARLAYVVHPSLLNELPPHQRDQLLDSNFYEVRPPPVRLGAGNALLTAELANRQRFGSRDQLASDLSSTDSEARKSTT